jgi:hypothetical protein
MPYTYMNFEILDVDNTPPNILNWYLVTLDRTYMYFRISTDESIHTYYMLTKLGTVTPPIAEIYNNTLRDIRGTRTNVTELFGTNSSQITPITRSYVYYDVYISFTGLTEETDYVLFFYVVDLSNNTIPT